MKHVLRSPANRRDIGTNEMARIHEKADAGISNISCSQKIIDFLAKMGTHTTVATWFHGWARGPPIGLVDATLISNGRSLRISKLQNDYERLKKAHVFHFRDLAFLATSRQFCEQKNPSCPVCHRSIAILTWRLCMEKVLEWRTFQKSKNGDDGGYSKLETDLSDAIRCCQHGVSGKGDLEAKTPNSPGKARDKREPRSWFPHFIGIFRTSPSISSRTTDLGEHPSVLRADKQENICSTGPYRCDPSTKAAELRSILISEHTFHVSSNVSTSDENWRIVPFPQTRDPVKNDRNSEYVS